MTEPARPICLRARHAPTSFNGAVRLAALVLAAVALATISSLASAHATIVFGTVTIEPAPGREGEPLTVRLEMRDPLDAPVEDAVVMAEARPMSGDAGEVALPEEGDVVSNRFREVGSGSYETNLELQGSEHWAVTLRDQTFPQEEARATISLRLGAEGDTEPLSFIFPPTATGPARLSTWLAWLIGLPLVAGLVVTIMVLRGGGSDG